MSNEDWNDLYVRNSVNETGPATGRRGSFGSPDIIPVGTRPRVPADFTTEASYGTYYSQNLYENTPNYLFVRARNSSPTETVSGRARLVMCNPALVLWPGGSDWTQITTSSGNDYSEISDVAPGRIGVAKDPFVCVPDASGHRCLVTWLSTDRHYAEDPPPRITENDRLVEFLSKHPNYAHHNIDLMADTTGKHPRTISFTSGDQPHKWVFSLRVKNCAGYKVGFTCGSQLADGSFIELGEQTVSDDKDFAYTIDRNVEAGFNANITWSYDTVGQGERPGADVSFHAASSLPRSHPLHALGYRYHTWDESDGLTLSENTAWDVGSVSLMATR